MNNPVDAGNAAAGDEKKSPSCEPSGAYVEPSMCPRIIGDYPVPPFAEERDRPPPCPQTLSIVPALSGARKLPVCLIHRARFALSQFFVVHKNCRLPSSEERRSRFQPSILNLALSIAIGEQPRVHGEQPAARGRKKSLNSATRIGYCTDE